MALDLQPRPKLDLQPRKKLDLQPRGQAAVPAQPTSVPLDKGEEGGLLIPARVEPSQVAAIAAKHKVNPDDLADWVGWYGGLKTDMSLKDAARFAAGELSESIGAGVPTAVARKLQTPEMERALDDLNQLVEHKKSTAQVAGEMAGGVAGALGLGKLAAKAVPSLIKSYQLAAMPAGGAAAGFGESAQGETAKATAIGAAIGTALPLGFTAAGKLARTGASKAANFVLTKNETIAKLIDKELQAKAGSIEFMKNMISKDTNPELVPLETIQDFLNKGRREPIIDSVPAGVNPEEFIRQTFKDQVDRVKADIARSKGKAPTADGFSEYLRDAGPDEVQKAYVNIVKDVALEKIARKGTLRPLTLMERGLLAFVDAKPAYEIFDKRMGTGLARSQDQASRKLAEADWAFSDAVHKADDLSRNMTPEESKAAIKAVEAGQATPWAQVWESLYEAAKDLGMPLRKRQNYVTQARLPLEEYQGAIAKRAQEVGLLNPESELSSPASRELLDELGQATNTKITNHADAQSALGKILGDDGALYSRIDLTAAMTKARDDVIPEWIRDTNMPRLLNRWMNAMKKQYAVGDHVEEIKRASKLAGFKGDFRTKDYLDNHLADILGNQPDSIREAWKSYQRTVERPLEDRIERASGAYKQVLEGRKDLPRLLGSAASKNLYANLIGLSPRAIIQNIASPFLGAISDQGADVGTKIWLEAQADLAKGLKDGFEIVVQPHTAKLLGAAPGTKIRTRNPTLMAVNDGLIGPNWAAEFRNPDLVRAKRNLLGQAIKDATGSYNKAAMALFEASEKAGRAQIALMGRRLGQHIIDNPKEIDALIKSPSYRARLKEMVLGGSNPAEVQKEVVQYLNGHTLLNFDKLNMSEYGRRVGPLFRQFTKFPSYAVGKGVQTIYEKGLGAGSADLAGTYLAPYLGFHLVDTLVNSEDNEHVKALIGRDGFKGWAIGSSALPMIESGFGIQKTPFVSLGAKTVREVGAAARGEKDVSEAAFDWLTNAYKTLGPGAGVYKLINDDIPAILNGEPKK